MGIELRNHCILLGTETILRKDGILLDNPKKTLDSGYSTIHTLTTSSLKQRHCLLLTDKSSYIQSTKGVHQFHSPSQSEIFNWILISEYKQSVRQK